MPFLVITLNGYRPIRTSIEYLLLHTAESEQKFTCDIRDGNVEAFYKCKEEMDTCVHVKCTKTVIVFFILNNNKLLNIKEINPTFARLKFWEEMGP